MGMSANEPNDPREKKDPVKDWREQRAKLINDPAPVEKLWLELPTHPETRIKVTNEVGGFVAWVQNSAAIRVNFMGRKKVMVKAKRIGEDKQISILKWVV